MPIDLQQWQADVVLGSCVKWLCSGPGAGFLWIDPARVAGIRLLDVGWFSHAAPFEFDIHHFEYAPDGVRFDVRPMGLRLSPHIYNSNEDIDTVVACLQG